MVIEIWAHLELVVNQVWEKKLASLSDEEIQQFKEMLSTMTSNIINNKNSNQNK